MIQLFESEYAPDLVPALKLARDNFGDRIACIWVSGPGPWDAFLERMPGHEWHNSFIFADGSYRHCLASATTIEDTPGLVDMRDAVTKILRGEAPNAGQLTMLYPIAIILRKNAYIVLRKDSARGWYVPLPGTTAHELVEDAALLERDFPGQFKLPS